ncbi:major coat protein [Marinospirillum sp. MEB164]|uniref:Major coat protein n=1 Tax=Marinospirillum alkalitolerans TaxID=3123374 RepID=A0ABW8PX17_9GAMM
MKQKLQNLRVMAARHSKKLAATAVAGTAVVSGQAMADLPAGATAAFSEVAGMGTALAAAAWPVVTVIMAGLIGISLFKKFISRAS